MSPPEEGGEEELSLSWGVTPCRHLRPSLGREHAIVVVVVVVRNVLEYSTRIAQSEHAVSPLSTVGSKGGLEWNICDFKRIGPSPE